MAAAAVWGLATTSACRRKLTQLSAIKFVIQNIKRSLTMEVVPDPEPPAAPEAVQQPTEAEATAADRAEGAPAGADGAGGSTAAAAGGTTGDQQLPGSGGTPIKVAAAAADAAVGDTEDDGAPPDLSGPTTESQRATFQVS